MKANPKILIISECFYPEQFKINDIAFNWSKQGYEVDVLTLIPTYPRGKVFPGYKNKLFSKEHFHGVNIIRVHAVLGYKESRFKKILKYLNFMLLGSIVALFIGKKYKHVFGFNLGALSDMLPAVIIRKAYKIPLTLWVQDLWPDSVYAYGFKKTKFLSFTLNKFVKFIFHSVDNIAISSKGFESNLVNYVPTGKKMHYFPNWPDNLNNELEPMVFNAEKKVQFTFAGNLGKVQNLENIIKAYSSLPKPYIHKSQLNIIGDGSNLSYLKSIASSNVPIVFHGGIQRDIINKYYRASDFLIISLINKPLFSLTVPAKLQTYILAKKPILAIINGETKEIVMNNYLGLYANPDDVQAIRELFKDCIKMPREDYENFLIKNNSLLNDLFNQKRIISGLKDLVVNH